jgi:hypothetical protein
MSQMMTLENNFMLNTSIMQNLMQLADVMSKSTVTMPNHLRGKPSDCLAIVMQAARWGMDPFAVAQKTHLVNGTMGYEAQLVNAVISSSRVIEGRFKYEYGGNWDGIAGKANRDEKGLFVRIGAVLHGEDEITWGEKVYLADVTTRNSPLWKTNPKQQIAYLAVKYWARLYCPEVILGVYTAEEMQPQTERDITPTHAAPQGNRLQQAINAKLQRERQAAMAERQAETPSDPEPENPEFEAMLNALDDCTDVQSYTEVVDRCVIVAKTLSEARRAILKDAARKSKVRIDRAAGEAVHAEIEAGSEVVGADIKPAGHSVTVVRFADASQTSYRFPDGTVVRGFLEAEQKAQEAGMVLETRKRGRFSEAH